jgi:alpha-tubulin suppressor-like RCC1 family protein
VSENAPKEVKPQDLGAAPGVRFVHAACGRNHTLLVGSCGTLWAAGANTLGQVRVVCVLFDFVVLRWLELYSSVDRMCARKCHRSRPLQ